MAENWKLFRQKFLLYLRASGNSKKDIITKTSILLHLIGDDGLRVYNSFVIEPNDDDQDMSMDLDTVLTKFDEHFLPKTNVTMERFIFNSRSQKEGEDIKTYVAELRRLSQTCDFEELCESLIRDRIICGLRDHKVRQRLLREPDLALDRAVELVTASELAEIQEKQLDASTSEREEYSQINLVRRPTRGRGFSGRGQVVPGRGQSRPPDWRGRNTQRWQQRQETSYRGQYKKPQSGRADSGSWISGCTNCGGDHQWDRCRAYGKNCDACGRLGHFKAYCKSSGEREVFNCEAQPRSTTDELYSPEDEEDGPQGEYDYHQDIYLDQIQVNSLQEDTDKWRQDVVMHGVTVRAYLDTGAQANVLPEWIYKKLKHTPTLVGTNQRLRAYNGQLIPSSGKVNLILEVKNKNYVAEFFIAQGNVKPIIGAKTCEEIGLIKRIEGLTKSNKYTVNKQECESLFQGLGCLPGEYSIEVDTTMRPVVHPCRKIPFPVRDKLKTELRRMEELKVIAKVEEATDWVSSIVTVTKKNGDLRVCLDPRDLNRAIKRQHFKLPTREEIMSKFAGATIFSKLDASQGFWQIKLDEKSSKLTTFITPFGRYRFLRLPFGLSSAPEVYQKTLARLFEGVNNVDTSMDDIIIYARDVKEHDETLNKVLDSCQQNGLKLNKAKCLFGVNELTFLGDLLTDKGIKPDAAKISAINNMKTPANKKDLKRFMGMVNYLAKWIPDMSVKSTPLRELLKERTEWYWGKEQDESFSMLKEVLKSEPVLQYYDPTKPTRISADASKDGLGSVLLQLHENQWKPVSYASRPMLDAETRYAQIEKELLAITFACERFHQFIFGVTIEVETDHKPLIPLFSKSLVDCPIRIQRMMLRMQRYDCRVTYVPGKSLVVADTLSRAPDMTYKGVKSNTPAEVMINNIQRDIDYTIKSMPVSDTQLERIKEATASDTVLQEVQRMIVDGWPDSSRNCTIGAKEYHNARDELSIAEGLILRGTKIVIPTSMREYVLKKIHEGHFGIDKCLRRARESLYWPGMSRDIKYMISQCSTCLKYSPRQQKETLIPHEIPTYPFQKVGTDLFEWKKKNYLIMADYFSLYPEVITLASTKSAAVINAMKSVFARHGTPEVLFGDNGPQFVSEEFKKFVADWDIKHVTASPYFPQSNGLAEGAVKIVKMMLTKTLESNGDIFKALQAYRSAPTKINDKSPAQLLMGRQIRSGLPVHPSVLRPHGSRQIVIKKKELKQKQKEAYDRGARDLDPLSVGEKVVMWDRDKEQWGHDAEIVERNQERSYLVRRNYDGKIFRRNRIALRKSSYYPRTLSQDVGAGQYINTPAMINTQPPRRSPRISRPPDRLNILPTRWPPRRARSTQ